MDNAEIFEQALSVFSNPVIFIDPNQSKNPIVHVNPAFVELTGYSEGEVLGKNFEFLEGDKTSSQAGDTLRRAIEQEQSVHTDILHYRGDGRTFWNEITMDPVYDDEGELLQFICEMRDITGQKQHQRELRRLKEEYETVFSTAQDAIFLIDVKREKQNISFQLRRLNPAHETISGLSTEEVRGKTPKQVLGEQAGEEVVENYRRCVNAKETISYEEELDMPARTIHWHTKLCPVLSGGEVTQIVGVARDITKQKQLQKDLEESLERQTTLLKEVHHRVKNNLQMIISLIKLQSRELDVPESVSSSFQELQSRIYSTALIHEQVYRKANLTNINARDYLQELAEYVIRSQSSSEEIELSTDIAPVDMSVERLLPCGLVTNELLTNALQHGFEGRGEGEIDIEFKRVEGGDYELVVADDGAGWKADSSFEEIQSLGMSLVKNLIRKQLNGSIELMEQHGGVGFRIVIPAEET